MRMRFSQTTSVVLRTSVVFALLHLSALQQVPLVEKRAPLVWNTTKIIYDLPKAESSAGGGGHADLTPPQRGIPPRTQPIPFLMPTTKSPVAIPALPFHPPTPGPPSPP